MKELWRLNFFSSSIIPGSGEGSTDESWDVEVKVSGSAVERLSWIDCDSWWGSLWSAIKEEFYKRQSRISLPSFEVMSANIPPAISSRSRAMSISKLR
jgi:hypothetical protein